MKPASGGSPLAVRRAASTTGLLFVLLLVAFTASNYSSLNTDRLIGAAPSSRAKQAAAPACDVARGEWVPDPAAPYYTNATCPFIDSRQDCMRYGKPGLGSILRWPKLV